MLFVLRWAISAPWGSSYKTFLITFFKLFLLNFLQTFYFLFFFFFFFQGIFFHYLFQIILDYQIVWLSYFEISLKIKREAKKGELALKLCKGKHEYNVAVIVIVFIYSIKATRPIICKKSVCSYFIVIKIVLKTEKIKKKCKTEKCF